MTQEQTLLKEALAILRDYQFSEDGFYTNEDVKEIAEKIQHYLYQLNLA